jgi:hypothetical protein
MNDTKLFDFFIGQWTLERRIYLKASEVLYATAHGEASFISEVRSAKLLYKERGKLKIVTNAVEIPFFRKFCYSFQAGKMNVFFADGPDKGLLYQQYIQDQNNKLIPDQTHICSDDIYKGEYHLSGADSFSLDTWIDGPHKDFLIKTLFTRVY